MTTLLCHALPPTFNAPHLSYPLPATRTKAAHSEPHLGSTTGSSATRRARGATLDLVTPRARDAPVAERASPSRCVLDSGDLGRVQITFTLALAPKETYEKRQACGWNEESEDEAEESCERPESGRQHGKHAVGERVAAWAEVAAPCTDDQAAKLSSSRPVRGVYETECAPAEIISYDDLHEMSDAAEIEAIAYPSLSPPPSYLEVEVECAAVEEPILEGDADETPSDELERDELLLELWRDRRTLILDSVTPHCMPHIAITPPENSWDLYWAWAVNTVPPQAAEYLTVSTPDACNSPFPYVQNDAHYSHLPQAEECRHEDVPSIRNPVLSGAARVFSTSKFAQLIGAASQERDQLFLDSIRAAMYKHVFKASALLACSVAPSFRAQWDAPGFRARFEAPLRWSDQASPLLAHFARCPGTTILDSATPCTVPHIVVQEPVQEGTTQWALYANATPSPQDCACGARLIVAAAGVSVVNEPYVDAGCWNGDWQSAGEAEHGTPESTWSEHSEESEGVPLTPDAFALDAVYEARPWHAPEHAAGCRLETVYEDVPLGAADPRMADFADDDEDDLPPFDDWYQSIAARTPAA